MRMEDSPALGKRKAEEKVDDKSNTSQGDDVPGDAVQADQKRRNVARTCIHEVAIPPGYVSTVDETVHGSISDPSYKGPMAKTYPFVLDPFQQVSVACLERNESVLVSAHTSAGKTAVAEYAIAMAFRDKQRVIYTSPLKALSNQKYRELSQEFSDVGLMTGDVSLSPNASCLVMTTEILRGMLYRGSELLKEVAWVIFDEIHYMKDRERGVVWEESIIFLPPAIKMVFLSATMSNATEFAEWICKLHSQPCHVVYTDFRPTPLQHYAFPIGGSGLYLVVDEKEQFREDNFMKLQEVFPKKIMDDGLAAAKNGLGLHGNAKGGPKGGKSTKTPGGDIYRIVKVAETRFASHTIVLRRLVRVKEALCQMVISNKWGGWKQVDTEKAKIVKDLIFNDDFWNRVEYALELTEPLMSMLRYADTDEPCLGNIYDAMDSMLERMKSVIQRREQDPDTLYSTVEKIVLHRWNKMTTPLHLLAYALSPRYYSSEILDIPGRVPPYRDPEVAAGYKRALSKLFSDPDVASNVRREFVDFVSGKFAEPDAINDQSRLDAIGWWYLHGERYMYLQPLAIKILSQMIMERKFQPVIIFSFSRRECEQHALSIMSKLDFNSEEEKQDVEQVFKNAILCLHEEDRNLPAVELMLPLLKRGIAVHHSGLLPIIKELVELLFQEGLVKALFATETFAMGLNMPAKTVVFTQLRKFDGDNHRYMTSGEYIQMSGRAGRRGKDERGISILIVDEQMEMKTCKDMILGKPAPLVSTFRLSYYTLLNLMSRAEGQFDQEYVIKNSFHQFQHEKALPEVEARVSKLEQEAAILDASEEAALAEYHKLRLHISHLEKQMMQEISRPERVLLFLVPGRLVKVRDGVTEWGWGVIVNTVKKPPVSGTLPSTILTNRTSSYIVDTLLHCTSTMTSDGPRPKPRPAISGQKGEMHVVPVQLSLICSLSTLRVAIPQDLRPPEARQSVLMAVQELEKRFPKGLPKLDPIEDMGIDDPDFVKIVKEVEETEQKLLCHPMHKAEQDENQYKSFQRKAELNNEAHQLRMKMRESQLHKFREELRNRSRVLKRLGHIDADGVVQLKGRAACYIDTGDELLATELMFNGVFNELDHHQVASLASCFVPCEKSNDAIHLSKEIQKPLQQLQDSARWIAQVQRECKLDVNPEEYVEATSRPFLMDIIYHWSKVAETRFASHTIVLRRLVKVKEALKHMVISAQWGIWKNSNTARAINVRRMILDEDWWGLVNYVLEITDPIMAMLRFADSDQPCLGDIYDSMDSMLEKIKMAIQRRENDPEDTLYKKVEKIVHHRWNKMTTPLHLLAYALSPRYYSAEVLDLPGRVPPFRDAEVADGYKKALAKIFQDPEIGAIVRSEFAAFNSGEDFLPIAIADQSRMSAIKWWYLHGQAFMYLQPLAIKVLSQGASFAEVTSKTDLFEGSIIRTTRRLEEFLNQLKAAARAIGDAALEKKFEDASESIRHGIIFANSLYL